MVSETSGTGGFTFLDEEDGSSHSARDHTISKYKAQLMQEYEDEMRRKQQIQSYKAAKYAGRGLDAEEIVGDAAFIPRSLGKVDPALNRMTKDEIKQIHSRHKRDGQCIASDV